MVVKEIFFSLAGWLVDCFCLISQKHIETVGNHLNHVCEFDFLERSFYCISEMPLIDFVSTFALKLQTKNIWTTQTHDQKKMFLNK